MDTWFLRQHPKVLGLPFNPGVKRVERVNAQVRYIEGDFTPPEYAQWLTLFQREPHPLDTPEKQAWLKSLAGVSLASDAFFPFPDGPELALDAGVMAIIQPGGSKRDDEVAAAVDRARAVMVLTGRRRQDDVTGRPVHRGGLRHRAAVRPRGRRHGGSAGPCADHTPLSPAREASSGPRAARH